MANSFIPLPVQTEYSLWTRNPELGVLDACADLSAAFVAFSPVGRGFLERWRGRGGIYGRKRYPTGMPRFQGANFEANQALFRQLQGLAERAVARQRSFPLRWLLSKAPILSPFRARDLKSISLKISERSSWISAPNFWCELENSLIKAV